MFGVVKAFPVGFEPTTCRLEGGCSIRLGYGNNRKGYYYGDEGKNAFLF